MSGAARTLLLVGELSVDFTLTSAGEENKLRLGGIAHAARGLWALGVPFEAAVVLPAYLNDVGETYLRSLGCTKFHILGEVKGAPNVTVVVDAIEVGDQGYDTLLRFEKSVVPSNIDLRAQSYDDVLIFPGSFDLKAACKAFNESATLHLDVAYDFKTPSLLQELKQEIGTLFLSTSSPFFLSLQVQTFESLVEVFQHSLPKVLILKENRGGTRLLSKGSDAILSLPAQLGKTMNSVGVGDVFAAAFVSSRASVVEAGWRATYAASAYSQTTYPDLFRNYVQRDSMLTLPEMQDLSGVSLPWDVRQQFQIYLAAPDFTHGDRRAIDHVISSLNYHNFNLRRPVQEFGQLPTDSSLDTLRDVYFADYALLKACTLLFAVPTGKDPGTLVEIGIALEARIPVIVFDPSRENANTMVIAGARHYSDDLDSCLNALFETLSEMRQRP